MTEKKGHKLADQEGIIKIKLDRDPQAIWGTVTKALAFKPDTEVYEFETWCCLNQGCNYLEFRLKEGHREDR